ncbi:hypothetical protein M9Y10_042442 [Tritrichomonas musculus]|uniref:Mediator of RNA polymerase II transcription subunit 18 n=1 Tax=Tritrichomonas musculus TaxID=1915356 RepID=A0ABR2GNW6_9EUKA
MSTNSDVKICKKQTTIPCEMEPAILQQLHDMCGQSSILDQMYTKYTHPKRDNTMIIDESSDSAINHKYTITTIKAYSDEIKDQNVFIQQSIISSVIGDAHDFVATLGFVPKHTWIERGNVFTHDSTKIKIFYVCNCDGVKIDPNNVVVSVEAISQITIPQIDSTCKRVSDIYRILFPDRLSFVPQRNMNA